MGSYVFRWPYPANDVHVTGTFDDWGKTEQLNKVGDHWEKEVDLPSADETYFYKFVVDDRWIVDDAAPKQDDGHWNVNNVLTSDKIMRKPKEITHSTPGAFPEDTESYSVQPIPATSGVGNPISIPAGEKLPEQKDITTNTIGSNVTTSKEDYENSGNDSFPTDGAKEAESYSINPIPASSGIGNPISVPAGEKLPSHEEATGNTIGSNVTTSKEDYENSGSSSFTGAGIAAGAAAGLAAVGAAGAAAFKKPEAKENLIPESSLPMGGAPVNTLDSGPFVSSVAPNTTTSELASKVPLEPKREATVADSMGSAPFISSAGAGTTTSELAAKVPLEKKRQAMIVDPSDAPSMVPAAASVPKTVQESISESFQAPEAAASTEAVKEKTDMEKELLSKTQRSEASGEPAAAASQQTSYYGLATMVPKPVETSMQKASASPEAAAETSVVAEKSAMEKELLSKVSSTDEAGEPAPSVTSSTSATAPSAAATTAAAVTGEKVAGSAPSAAAAVSDGATDDPDVKAPKISAPIEKSEAATTEYAPVRTAGATPGVSSAAAAALSDGTEDPTLADEPAVRMMKDNAAGETVQDTTTSTKHVPTATSTGASTGVPASSTTTAGSAPPVDLVAGVPAITSVLPAGTKATEKQAAEPKTTTTTTTGTSAPSTPAKKTNLTGSAVSSPASSTATKEKKKRHRLSAFFHKIVDH